MSVLVRSCPVCAGAEREPFLVKGTLALVRCPGCSMVYAHPVPAAFVSGEYYDQEAAGYYLSPAKLQSDYSPVRFERELRLFRQHCPGGAVLDVGCSTGAFLHQLTQRFPGDYTVLGTDASGPALAHAASRGVPVTHGEFPSQDFGGRTFDAITFWAVLEHLPDPKAFLDKAWTILKPEGRCFVLVPNLESLAARLLGYRYRYIYAQHLNYFTPATLKRLAQPRFVVTAQRSTHFNPVIIWQDWRHGGAEVSNQERAQLLQRTTAYKRNPLFKPARLAYQLAERALAALRLADNIALVLRKSAPE